MYVGYMLDKYMLGGSRQLQHSGCVTVAVTVYRETLDTGHCVSVAVNVYCGTWVECAAGPPCVEVRGWNGTVWSMA